MNQSQLEKLLAICPSCCVEFQGVEKSLSPGFYSVREGQIEVTIMVAGYRLRVCVLTLSECFFVSKDQRDIFFQPSKSTRLTMISLKDVASTDHGRILAEELAQPLNTRIHQLSSLALALGHLIKDISAGFIEELFLTSEFIQLKPWEILFREGSHADSVYVLISGKLQVYVGSESDVTEVGSISRGEIFGEMSVLSGDPRSASIRATRNSEMVRLGENDFEALSKKYPPLEKFITRLLIDRIKRQNERLKRKSKSFNRVILTLAEGKTNDALGSFVHDLESESLVIAEDSVLRGFTEKTIEQIKPIQLNQFLDQIEQSSTKCHYFCRCQNDQWVLASLSRADEIWLVVDAREDSQTLEKRIAAYQRHPGWESARRVLVLLHAEREEIYGTAERLKVTGAAQHFHIQIGESADWQRLKRYLLGQSIGLVLGGGGARGFGHIGMMKAFESAGLKFDWFGGTSIGAIMAAWIAQGLATDQIVQSINKFFVDVNPLGDYTLPLVSLSRSIRLDNLLEEGLGVGNIEDMPLPFFCISSDLSVAAELLHNHGVLWRAVRASIAIPGVVAPVIQDGHFLVDGALLNNLPVDHMLSHNPGPVVAIDVSDNEPYFTDEKEIPTASRYLWRRVIGKPPGVPSILETLLRSTALAGSNRVNTNKTNADIYIKPDLTRFGMLEFKAANAIIEAGHQAGLAALDKELKHLL